VLYRHGYSGVLQICIIRKSRYDGPGTTAYGRCSTGYATFLREKELALARYQPHLMRWERWFLLLAWEHGGYKDGEGQSFRAKARRLALFGAARREDPDDGVHSGGETVGKGRLTH